MKKLLLLGMTTLFVSITTQASEKIDCRASNLSQKSEVAHFQVIKGQANLSTKGFKIAGKPYQMDITLSPDYLKISVKRNDHVLHYSKVWTNATLLENFHFSFLDGQRKMAVICGQ